MELPQVENVKLCSVFCGYKLLNRCALWAFQVPPPQQPYSALRPWDSAIRASHVGLGSPILMKDWRPWFPPASRLNYAVHTPVTVSLQISGFIAMLHWEYTDYNSRTIHGCSSSKNADEGEPAGCNSANISRTNDDGWMVNALTLTIANIHMTPAD